MVDAKLSISEELLLLAMDDEKGKLVSPSIDGLLTLIGTAKLENVVFPKGKAKGAKKLIADLKKDDAIGSAISSAISGLEAAITVAIIASVAASSAGS
ncbi:hypothetical protein F7C95_03010 [Opitutia bacterium ISCC 51]|nr:hypothetical protein F7C95_03010 [Opitutae bacterium ISCC 51]